MKSAGIQNCLDLNVAIEISEKNLDDAVANANMRLEAQQSLINNLESKAMNFLALIITVCVALFAAIAASLSRPEPYAAEIVLIISAMVCSVASAIIIAFRVLSFHSWYLPGQDPDDYLHPEKIEWAKKTEASLGTKALNTLYLKDLNYYLKYNLREIKSQVRAYRFGVCLFSVSISLFGIIYAVASCFLLG